MFLATKLPKHYIIDYLLFLLRGETGKKEIWSKENHATKMTEKTKTKFPKFAISRALHFTLWMSTVQIRLIYWINYLCTDRYNVWQSSTLIMCWLESKLEGDYWVFLILKTSLLPNTRQEILNLGTVFLQIVSSLE